MTGSLSEVRHKDDILPDYQDGPVGDLLSYENLGKSHNVYTLPRLLIGTCMDHRIELRIPKNFACVLRVAGSDLRRVEFDVSYEVAVRGVRAIALVAHENCGMEDLGSQREKFVDGLVTNGGWQQREAEEQFDRSAPGMGTTDTIGFVRSQARRLMERYPKVLVAPLFYSVGESVLYQIRGEAGALRSEACS